MILMKTVFNKRWWWVTLIVIGILLLFVRLGIWQLNRLEERRAENEQLRTTLATEQVVLDGSYTVSDNWETLAQQTAVATGTYDYEQQLIIKLQNFSGRPGFYLLTPLQLGRNEAGEETAVLVNRGWLPDNEQENIASYQPNGEQTITGYVALPETLTRVSVTPTPSAEWFRADVSAIAEQLPYDILPFYLIESPIAEPQTELPYKLPQELDLSEGSHLSYALQWFLFALIGGAGYLIYVNKTIHQNN